MGSTMLKLRMKTNRDIILEIKHLVNEMLYISRHKHLQASFNFVEEEDAKKKLQKHGTLSNEELHRNCLQVK